MLKNSFAIFYLKWLNWLTDVKTKHLRKGMVASTSTPLPVQGKQGEIGQPEALESLIKSLNKTTYFCEINPTVCEETVINKSAKVRAISFR